MRNDMDASWKSSHYASSAPHAAGARLTLCDITIATVSTKRLDESWTAWLRENIARGCNPEELLGILLTNAFEIGSIRSAMGTHYPAQSPLALAAENRKPDPVDRGTIASPWITRPESGAKRFETDRLQLYTLDAFLSQAECDALVTIINRYLRPSTVTIESSDKAYRTSQHERPVAAEFRPGRTYRREDRAGRRHPSVVLRRHSGAAVRRRRSIQAAHRLLRARHCGVSAARGRARQSHLDVHGVPERRGGRWRHALSRDRSGVPAGEGDGARLEQSAGGRHGESRHAARGRARHCGPQDHHHQVVSRTRRRRDALRSSEAPKTRTPPKRGRIHSANRTFIVP